MGLCVCGALVSVRGALVSVCVSIELSLVLTHSGVILAHNKDDASIKCILSAGGIPWLMVAELFMQEARPVALTIATTVNWIANCVVGFVFPYILVSRAVFLTKSRN